MSRLLARFGIAGLAFFTVKGLVWLAVAAAAAWYAAPSPKPGAPRTARPAGETFAPPPAESVVYSP